MLIHSRFTREHRRQLEDKLLNDFNHNTEPCIVVSTQVVEVSIDINFDALYTDCSDIMSLIQRFGRINRQRKNIGVIKPIYIIANDEYGHLPYNETICQRTFTALEKYNNTVLPETDIQKVIDEVHPTLDEFKMTKSINSVFPLFSHNTNDTISTILEFSGYIGIQECNIDKYKETRNPNLEIPLPPHRVEDHLVGYFKNGEYKPVGKTSDKTGLQFIVIPNANYSNIIGFF